MGHSISGILVEGAFDSDAAALYDLHPRIASAGITFFPIDHYFLAYWAHKLKHEQRWVVHKLLPPTFPAHSVLQVLVDAVAPKHASRFGVVMTDYFGGIGEQWAAIVSDGQMLLRASINDALLVFGVRSGKGQDAFATYGFCDIRQNPDYLLKYGRWCKIYGI